MIWRQHDLHPLGISVGPCAWSAAMLASGHADYIHAHPSLIFVGPDDDDAILRAIGPRLAGLPIMLGVHEPDFSRRAEAMIRSRIAALGVPRVDIVTLWVDDDPTRLKGGGVLHTLLELRHAGLFNHLGLAHHDARQAEWMALNTPARLIATRYSLNDQSARYRAVAAGAEHGMAALAIEPTDSTDIDAVRFALAEYARVLPVLGTPLPEDLKPMTAEEVEDRWARYRAAAPEPKPLPRGAPPGIGGD